MQSWPIPTSRQTTRLNTDQRRGGPARRWSPSQAAAEEGACVHGVNSETQRCRPARSPEVGKVTSQKQEENVVSTTEAAATPPSHDPASREEGAEQEGG